MFLGDTGLGQAGSLLPLSVLETKSREQIPGAVQGKLSKAGACGEGGHLPPLPPAWTDCQSHWGRGTSHGSRGRVQG